MTDNSKKLMNHILDNDINSIITDLSNGVDPNVPDNGMYPLISAIGYPDIDSPKIVKLLLSWGANMYVEDKYYHTPLTKAASYKDVEVTKILLDYGFDPNTLSNYDHSNALFFLIENPGSTREELAIMDLLIGAGIDINHQRDNGDTPLIAASKEGKVDLIKDLLARGADVTLKNQEGKTYLDEADIRTLFGLAITKADITDEKFEWLKKQIDQAFLNNDHFEINLLVHFLRDNGVPEDEITRLLKYGQQVTPKVIRGTAYPRSGRSRTTMRRLLPASPPTLEKQVKILNNFDINKLCFCLSEPSGPVSEEVAIPVTRYGLEAGHGFYGRKINPNAQYTWYYVEPDSDRFLVSDKVFISRNKITMFIQLSNEVIKLGVDKRIMKLLDTIKKYWNVQLSKYYKTKWTWEQIIDDNEIILGRPGHEEEGRTNYLRNFMTNQIGFEGGKMDKLDSAVWDLARQLGYDILIFSHQPGNYERLVAECLDVRNRMTSLASIVKL